MMTRVFLLLTLISSLSHAAPSLMPLPAELTVKEGALALDQNTSLSYSGDYKEMAEFFASELRAATGWALPVTQEKSTITVVKTDWPTSQGYSLSVRADGATLKAGTSDNLFYAFQTLRQLCPAEVFDRDGKTAAASWSLSVLEITDAPRFSYRGILVDVSRHFQPVDEMLKVLDAMALAKLNILHWHLTDNEGWRAEIKAYPKLTEVSKKFYTQEELKRIVKYASLRGITIIPEIDVPGHSKAAVRAYPFLGTTDLDGKISMVINPVSPKTYEFLDTVFAELAAIFPSPVFHMGADEVGMAAWKKNPDCVAFMKEAGMRSPHDLHAYFTHKAADILKKHGKKSAAWDEAYHGEKSAPGLIISSWRGVEPGHEAAEAGHQVIMCPVSSLYYDRANSRSKNNPKAYSANTVSLSQSYFFEPQSPLLSDKAKANVLGAQGCVWGEKITSGPHLQRQVMLRGAALGEALWSPRVKLDWNDFLKRLTDQRERLDALGVPYWWEPETTARQIATWTAKDGKQTVTLPVPNNVITRAGLHELLCHYRSGTGSFKLHKVELLADGKAVAEDAHSSTATIDPRRPDQYYLLKINQHAPAVKYSIRLHYEGVKGGCEAIAMLLPALAEDNYSKSAGPNSKANLSGRKQPDER
ncbi:beta-N-acetylhexosaminidase [Oceaniferula spumae]